MFSLPVVTLNTNSGSLIRGFVFQSINRRVLTVVFIVNGMIRLLQLFFDLVFGPSLENANTQNHIGREKCHPTQAQRSDES